MGNNDEQAAAAELYSEAEFDRVEAHIRKYFGKYKNVFHEVLSPDIHVDIAIIDPSAKRNYYVLVTMGMGAHSMNVPQELEGQECERAEVLVCLPPDWNMQDFNDEKWYWPLRWLKIMARLPIEQNTWLGWGHTVPAGEPFAENTQMNTMLLLNPGAFGKGCELCKIPGGVVNFYQMIPIYQEEVDLKLEKGTEGLLEVMDRDLLEVVDPARRNVCDD
ncbi:MAG: suppressor of fused domain protein [Spirochaetales bacterium]|jgi:hypothetical protein|nr:suppressor of fused domain protein [Spirochaetales bacterium]